MAYALLLVGEAMIGLVMGFFLSIVYSAFTTAGQFFSLQIGFGASETYDPLAEVELPLMGQFLNLIAMSSLSRHRASKGSSSSAYRVPLRRCVR